MLRFKIEFLDVVGIGCMNHQLERAAAPLQFNTHRIEVQVQLETVALSDC
jgi:hypothetical protein